MRIPLLLALTLCVGLLAPAVASLSRGELDERLLASAEKADVIRCRELLRDGASVAARDAAGRTPLIIACDNFPLGEDPEPPRTPERLELCRLLLRAKADVNARSLDGSTALITASGSNGAGRELARLLLQSGAKPNLADRLGQTALMFASGVYGDAETQSCFWSGARSGGRPTGKGIPHSGGPTRRAGRSLSRRW